MAKDKSTSFDSEVLDDFWPTEALAAEVLRQARQGNPEAAILHLEELRLLTKRQTAGSMNLDELQQASGYSARAVGLTCDLAAGQGLTDQALSRLAAIWEPGDLGAGDLINVVSSEARALPAMLNGPPIGLDSQERLTLRINATLNHAHRLLRLFRDEGLATAPTRRDSLYPALDRDTPDYYSLRIRGFNQGRHAFIHWAIARPVQDTVYGSRMRLFQARAIRVWLAIKRWQLLRPDSSPPRLEELIPAFLPEIPSDPWDGQPLRWDYAQQAIFTIGSNWVRHLPALPASSRRWIVTGSGDDSTAALRLNLPPLPPAKPPVTKKPVSKPKSARP